MSELAGVERLPLSSIRLWRKIVQRLIWVKLKAGSGERFDPESHAPSCGGGLSLSGSESGATPTLLSRKVESSTTRWPPALVLDHPSAFRSNERVLDQRVAVTAGADVQAGVVEPGRVDVLEEAVDRVAGEQPVAAEQTGVVGGQVLAPPAVDPDPAAVVTGALPPHLVAVQRVLAPAPVEVADSEVLDPDAIGLDHDAVADVVAAVEDHRVAVDAADVEPRRADHHRAGVHAAVDQDPVPGCAAPTAAWIVV